MSIHYKLFAKALTTISLLFSNPALSQDNGIKIPFQLVNNHIYFQGKLKDSVPVWILLDCGSSSLVSEQEAIKAKIKTKPAGQTAGTGNGVATYQLADSVSFDLGAIRYVEKRIPVLSLDEVDDCAARINVGKEGRIVIAKERRKNYQPIDAVLGDKFFRRFIIEIDFQKEIMTLYEPATFRYSGKGDRVPLEYTDNHIYLVASVQGSDSVPVAGRFMVDCGSMTGVILNTPFIEQHNLKPPPDATEIVLCGIGGNSKSMMGTLAELQVGKQMIKGSFALFSQASGGVLTNPDMAGTIGNAVWRNFRVIYDYSRKEMILENQDLK